MISDGNTGLPSSTEIPSFSRQFKSKMKIVICLNSAWNLVNFRTGLIRALVKQGYEVVAMAPSDSFASRLAALGCRFVPIPMANSGTNPLQDCLLLWRFCQLLQQEQPDVYLGYTVKPNIYGSIAAHWLGIPVINNIAGLGAVFIQDGWLVRIVRRLYAIALGRSAKVFFQNADDLALFINGGLVQPDVTDLLPGSGIDLAKFKPMTPRINSIPMDCRIASARRNDGNFRFLLIARMLRDKGVVEYVEAARQMRQHWPQAEFCLLGSLDVKNPAAISRAEMDAWVAEGVVNYLDVSDDVRDEIATADCIVLPSYREGTPRALLEAAAMARPIVTTDAVGCREVVDDGVNGYLCRIKDSTDLAEKMSRVIAMPLADREKMGLLGRAKVEKKFDEKFVINKYLESIKIILKNK